MKEVLATIIRDSRTPLLSILQPTEYNVQFMKCIKVAIFLNGWGAKGCRIICYKLIGLVLLIYASLGVGGEERKSLIYHIWRALLLVIFLIHIAKWYHSIIESAKFRISSWNLFPVASEYLFIYVYIFRINRMFLNYNEYKNLFYFLFI